MHSRRGFLRAAFIAALGLALPPLRRALRVERRGRVFLVDGWVLTADDVRALTRVL